MKKISSTIIFLLVPVLFLSGCQKSITRNPDGSITAETSITQAELQQVITEAIADPLIKDIAVKLHSGYISVAGERERLNEPAKVDTLSLRLDLGVSNGELTASISNAQLDGVSIEADRVENWNQTIANRLANLMERGNRNATLQSVSITPEQVNMVWVK